MFARVILLLLLSATIVYFNKVPANIRRMANSIPGRIVLFAGVVAMYETAGWMPALLMTLIGLLLIAGGASVEGFVGDLITRNPRTGLIQSEGFVGENFSSDIDIIEKKPGTKWWDEVLLGRESVVKTSLVDTQPVQG